LATRRAFKIDSLPVMTNGAAGQGSSGQRHEYGAEDLRDGEDVHVPRQQEAGALAERLLTSQISN
jgi:hypothetical protein